MTNFFHRLFNPHCPDCIAAERELDHCSSCETLREQLSIANREKDKLLQALLEVNKPKTEETRVTEKPEPLNPRYTPWRVRQQILEEQDRERAKLMKQAARDGKAIEKVDTEDLERALEIDTQEKTG